MEDKNGKLIWISNEGQYRYMNTFDLTIDHLFWEMRFHPWTIRYVLDMFAQRYSYYDEVRDFEGNYAPGGISFTHDMGTSNMFSPKGFSDYECSDLTGVWSYMTCEELTNWILCASVYSLNAKDIKWLNNMKIIFIECFNSLVLRDQNNDGIVDTDSSRCDKGSEVTTYDSLDASLGQARNNLYLAIKTWAAYVCMENIFKKLELEDYSIRCHAKALDISDTLHAGFNSKEGYIPAVLKKGNESKIISAIEGLIYPYIVGDYDAVSGTGRYAQIINLLKQHLSNVLVSGVCLDKVSGGWKLSSTSNNTWMSKIFLNQFIASDVLDMSFSQELSNKWDEIHASWQAIQCNELCAVDQINSETGEAKGSRLYPRLVTNILWMNKEDNSNR